MKIKIARAVNASLDKVWDAWNNPADIMQWNAASDDWHTTASAVDLRVGGRFCSRMEAKDGSAGFDLCGTYTRLAQKNLIAYSLDDGRTVEIEFSPLANGVRVTETFEAETQNDPELQREGWQSILDNFARHVEAKAGQA